MENEFHVVAEATTTQKTDVKPAEKVTVEAIELVVEPVVESEATQSEDPTATVNEGENETEHSYEGDQVEHNAEEEVFPWDPRLEEGFSTMRAQLLYYEFLEAADGVNSGTDEEMELFHKARDTLDKHANELSLLKQLSVIMVLFRVAFILLAHQAVSRRPPLLQTTREV